MHQHWNTLEHITGVLWGYDLLWELVAALWLTMGFSDNTMTCCGKNLSLLMKGWCYREHCKCKGQCYCECEFLTAKSTSKGDPRLVNRGGRIWRQSTSKGDPRLVNRGGRSLKSVKEPTRTHGLAEPNKPKLFLLRSSQKSSVRTGFTRGSENLHLARTPNRTCGPVRQKHQNLDRTSVRFWKVQVRTSVQNRTTASLPWLHVPWLTWIWDTTAGRLVVYGEESKGDDRFLIPKGSLVIPNIWCVRSLWIFVKC